MASTTIPTANIDIAVASAAIIVVNNAFKILGDTRASSEVIREAIMPIYGITWTRPIFARFKQGRLNSFLAKVRNSTLPRSEYDRLASFWKQAYEVQSQLLPEWEEWRILFERFRFDRRYNAKTLADTVAFLYAKGISPPQFLGSLPLGDVESFSEQFQEMVVLRAIWRISRLTFSQPSSSAHLTAAHAPLTANKLFRSIKRCSEDTDADVDPFAVNIKKGRLPLSFLSLGPLEKIKHLQASSIPAVKLDRFIMDSTQLNMLKQIKGSLPPMASAVRCFSAFCELRGAPTFPPSEELVVQWSSVFPNTPTYYNYVQHLKNACIFLRLTTEWLSPAVKLIAKGLKKCQDKSFKFSNFIRSAQLLQIIEYKSMEDEFAQACMISFLFAFRVPSETLSLVRAFKSDKLTEFSPQKERALINVVSIADEEFLVAKFSTRKNIDSGCILKRPCFCRLGSDRAGFLCPVHALWPWIRRRTPCGQKLFRAVNRRNFNRFLKRTLGELGFPEAERYSSHAFRRGATQELRESGSGWPVIASMGVWNSPAFKGYVDITQEVEAGVRQLFISACEPQDASSSEGEQ